MAGTTGGNMKLFISGPMTGVKHNNLPMFSLVSGALVDLGHNVFSPPHDVRQDQEYRACLGECLDWLCREAEGIVSLPGWSDSPGALSEAATARAIKIPHWDCRIADLHAPRFFPASWPGNPAVGSLLQEEGESLRPTIVAQGGEMR